MTRLKSFAVLSFLTALLCIAPQGVRGDDLPDEIPEPVKERIRQLPEEVQERIREAIKKQLAERDASADDSSEDGDEEASEEKEKKDDSSETKEKPKTPEKALSDRVKKLKEEMQQMDTEFQYKIAQYKQELEEQRLRVEKLKLENQLAQQLRDQESQERKLELAKLKEETEFFVAQSKLAKAKLDAEVAGFTAERAVIEAKLANKSAEQKLESVVLTDNDYHAQPFKNGVLYVSDRRIELNGPIFSGAAKYVCDRIHYFNNKSHDPIFLIIDSSPGGSGMEGLQIVQAIQNSDAPIHVVVKRYAASMAAIITTLADFSYAYPDAIILHHQASAMVYGNTTAMKEDIERIRQMSSRLVGEVAEKIGCSEEEFIKEMYENRSTGDWDLFADQAVERGWIDHVVQEIREDSVRKRPSGSRTSPLSIIGLHKAPVDEGDRYQVMLTEETDDKGRPFVRLPRLSPLDAWFLFNPDGYYR